MSVLLTSLLVAGGAAIGAFVSRRLLGRREPAPSAPAGDVSAAPLFEGFPCALGDVVVRATGEEAWLAGALVLSEDRPVALLFFAPDSGGDRVLFVRPEPSPTLSWLTATKLDCSDASEPPTSLEHGRARYARLRRLPLHAKRVGQGAPDLGDQLLLAEYAAGGRRVVVLSARGALHAYAGDELVPGTYDVLRAGASTL